MGTYNVTDLHHIAREGLYVIHDELKKRDDIEVMPIAPGEHELFYEGSGKWESVTYPNIRCTVPECGLTVLMFNKLHHCSTTLTDDFLAVNNWDSMKKRFIQPMACMMAEQICQFGANSYLYFARLKPGDGSDGTAWYTLSNCKEVVRVSTKYRAQKGMQIMMETCCSSVSKQ